jgi:hypothetical protein
MLLLVPEGYDTRSRTNRRALAFADLARPPNAAHSHARKVVLVLGDSVFFVSTRDPGLGKRLGEIKRHLVRLDPRT